ncbi:MAG: hypothetical protein ACPG5U_04890 [Planktomarina sp.]
MPYFTALKAVFALGAVCMCLTIAPSVSAWDAVGRNSRTDALIVSFVNTTGWEIVSDIPTKISLLCVACLHPISLVFEKIPHAEHQNAYEVQRRQDIDRKQTCFDLVSRREGRCVSTKRVGWRWLSGDQTVTEIYPDTQHVEIVYILHNFTLKTVIMSEINTNVTNIAGTWAFIMASETPAY